MKILLTGATGYIGQRLLPVLLEEGHEVICVVRDKHRFDINRYDFENIDVYEADFSEHIDASDAPKDVDVAFYLIHSMSGKSKDFEKKEAETAHNFLDFAQDCQVKQIVYLSGIVNEEKLSKHLRSRLNVEKILMDSPIASTVLRAGIVVGSGSASFEILRDLVEKLPLMICPRWVQTLCQPIAVRDVIKHLKGVMLLEETYNKHFDIGGPQVLTYKDMMEQFAEVRELKRYFILTKLLSPRLSSYWLYFITSTSYQLAVNLVNSMKVNVVCEDKRLENLLELDPMTYKEAVQLAFDMIEQDLVMSSWIDAAGASYGKTDLMKFVQVPKNGCFVDYKEREFSRDPQEVIDNLWAIGGKRGWYYGNILWKLRGFLDRLVGGIGLRRGRRSATRLRPGDALDFWRVLIADKKNKKLLLHAEMKVPGNAWLQFEISPSENGRHKITQTATFRPKGLFGRLYWYVVLPFHYFIFNGMIDNLISYNKEPEVHATPRAATA